MCLQQSIINRYQKSFPRQTLNETSKLTGIQLTRVFRIYNGSEMKVKEFEAFEKAIHSKEKDLLDTQSFYLTIGKCLETLDTFTLSQIQNELQTQVKNKILTIG